MRHAPVILVMLALLGACAPKGKYVAPADTTTARIEQVDRAVTYALDPKLDALVVDFECSFMETLTYDYGDTIGKIVRDTFERRFSSAVETDADSADYVLGYVNTTLTFEGKKQMFSYDTHLAVRMSLVLLDRPGGRLEPFSVSGGTQEDVYGTFCGAAPDMITRLTPTMMRSLARLLAMELDA